MKETQISEDLTLSPLKEKHASDIFDTLDRYRDRMRVWLPFIDTTLSVNDSLDYIRYAKSNEKTYAIIFKGEFAGMIGIKSVDESNEKAELGYWISPAFEGKGLVSQSARALIDYAFNTMNLNRLLIQVAVGNTRSIRIAERLGFKKEGIERDGEKLVNGFTNIVKFGLLKRDFNAEN